MLRVVFDGGRDHRIPLVSYRPPQAGQAPASKGKTRHGLPASVGAWSLEYIARQVDCKLRTRQTTEEENVPVEWSRVGFAVRNTLLRMIEPPTDGTEKATLPSPVNCRWPCQPSLRLRPTRTSPGEVKDQFCESLDAAIGKIPSSEHVFLLGDFNATVCADRESWPRILGHHGN